VNWKLVGKVGCGVEISGVITVGFWSHMTERTLEISGKFPDKIPYRWSRRRWEIGWKHAGNLTYTGNFLLKSG
jgi:hypothetical protein